MLRPAQVPLFLGGAAFATKKTTEEYRDLVETRKREWQQPSRMHYVEVTYDEQRRQFATTYCGVTANGESPEMACDNFDHLWLLGELNR